MVQNRCSFDESGVITAGLIFTRKRLRGIHCNRMMLAIFNAI
jgi:hypothetical protein